MIVALSPKSLAELAGHEFGRPDASLRPLQYTIDCTVLQFAQMIKAELNRPELGIHVLRKCSDAAGTATSVKGSLSPIAAQRIQDYLHEHFRRKMTIPELASVCGLSPGNFAHVFAKTFGISPQRYVLERRLDFAEKMLSQTELPVAEIAFLSGFFGQSHLTNMMRSHRRKTPRQFRCLISKPIRLRNAI